MSGGSLDYVYARVDEAVGRIYGSPLHNAFAQHLIKVAKALHDIEWVMSGDMGKGEDEAAILECISRSDELASAIDSAEAVLVQLQNAVTRAKS